LQYIRDVAVPKISTMCLNLLTLLTLFSVKQASTNPELSCSCWC